MRNIIATLLLLVTLVSSCTPISNIFGKKTPHEKYAAKLDKTDLEETPAGRQWLAASKSALLDPQLIELPYNQNGYFGLDKPRALGLKFNANRGEQLNFKLSKRVLTPFALFVDIFKLVGSEAVLLHSVDTSSSRFNFDIAETGTYILRLQPELLRSGEYNLSISIGPSLGFPVTGNKAKTGSFWGASRDGGKRHHEGIDIFAPKRVPVVAAADGIITGVKEGGLGGKVVWMKLQDKDLFLYYAHLDKQLVREGESVKYGDTLGLVGNTGNAKHTPSHLHFGIYTNKGPIDPFPFVNPLVKTAPIAPDKNLANYLRLTKPIKVNSEIGLVKADTRLIPLAITNKGYIAELPDGKMIQVPFASVQQLAQPVRSIEAVVTKFEKNKRKDAKKEF